MSENHQFVDNPLHLNDLFAKGIYYFGEQVNVTILEGQIIDNELVSSDKTEVIVPLELPILDGEVVEAKTEINQVITQNTEEMTALTVINLFFDAVDGDWSAEVDASYHKLMSAIKVNQEPVISEDIEKILLADIPAYDYSVQGDLLSPVIFIWSDRKIQNVPNLYKARPTEKGVMLRFPSFNSMCLDIEKKKMVWQLMKQVLKF